MKVLAINGSPRKNGNTATLLKKALEGAKSNGADTKFIQLSELDYKGCMSCFACKLIEGSHRCTWNDDLKPILSQMEDSDVIIFGSPIYFMRISAILHGCLERFLFQYYTYDPEKPTSLPKTINTAFIYTMNMTEEQAANYKAGFNSVEAFTQIILGKESKIFYSYNTYQYPDYSKYEHKIFNVEDKKRQKETQFPKDLEAAYQLGKEMTK